MSRLQNADDNRAMTEAGHMEITDIYKNMKQKFSRLLVGFGAAQIAIGFLCLFINGYTLGMFLADEYSGYTIPGYGLFPGLTFIAAGALGVAAGLEKKKSLVVASNVLCIASACLCFAMFICAIYSASVDGKRKCYYARYGSEICDEQKDRSLALDLMLAFFALLEVVCAIGSSVVCCYIGSCCCDCSDECCCPPIVPQQPANLVLNPSKPAYYVPGANQMTIQPGQQQPGMQLSPNQPMAQNNAMSASSDWGNSGMSPPTDDDVYEPLTRGMPVPVGRR